MKYSIIYADCPWTHSDKNSHGKRGAIHKYNVMTLKDICELPVQNIAADDCTLFMWATAPLIPEALKTMDAWGFKYKTVGFTWIKTCKNDHSKTRKNLGHYTRGNAEFVLIGRRGKMLSRVDKGVSSVIISPQLKHSQKPAKARERIVQLYGDLPRVELFARETAPGWISIGDGIDGQDIREVLGGMA
jgi:N6-adenosine-specific RNA methylase IME4